MSQASIPYGAPGNRGLLDYPPFNEPYDPLWDLAVLPASAVSLLVPGFRLAGALGLALWSSRAVALYGMTAEELRAAKS